MSTLIVHELETPGNNTVFQEIKPTQNINLAAIRPHLYLHNAPSGKVRVEVQDENGRLIKASAKQTITDLKTLAFAHGYHKFDIDTPLIKDIKYRIAVVTSDGYTFAESAYIGVCKDWDDEKTNQSYSPNNQFDAPLDFELWERTSDMRELDFTDNFESSTEPTQGSIEANALATFANDAAFEAAKGSSGVDGDIYYNTTIESIKYNDSGAWRILDRIGTKQTAFTIANDQSVPADITGLTADGDVLREILVRYHVIRDDAGTTRIDASGSFKLVYNATDKWELHDGGFGPDNHGLVFTVVNTLNIGQVKYTSTDIGGTPTGTFTYEIRTFTQ